MNFYHAGALRDDFPKHLSSFQLINCIVATLSWPGVRFILEFQ